MHEVKKFFGFVEEDVNSDSSKPNKPLPKSKPFKGNLISSQQSKQFASTEIKIAEPRVYEDSLNIASYLRDSKPVIVNLKFLDTDAGKRLIDFICGTAYAINGHMLKIGENIFLFTPYNVLISNSEERSTFEQGIDNSDKDEFIQKVI